MFDSSSNPSRGRAHRQTEGDVPRSGLSRASSGLDRVAPRRAHYLALAAAMTALAVYGSLVPLELRAVSWEEALARFKSLPYYELGIESRSDWVANILLFVPLGYLMTAALRVDRPGLLRAVVAFAVVLPICVALSTTIEFTQIWFAPRTVSQNDIAAEILGALAGIGLWGLVGQRITAFARVYATALSPRRKVDLILQAYLVGLLIYSVLPLDLTISPADLWRKYRDGKVVLFGLAGGNPAEVVYAVLAKIVPFAPVGLLISSLDGPRQRRVDRVVRGLVLGGILAAVLEVAQLLVYSRFSNGADLLWGALGTGLGAGWSRNRSGDAARCDASPPRHAWAWLSLGALYTAVLAFIFWQPFGFTKDKELILRRLHQVGLVPFAGLYWGTDWNAIGQISSKVLWFVPLGALLARGLVAGLPGNTGWRLRVAMGLASCLVVAMAIEFGQVFLPGRFADLTDVLLYETGAALGLLVAAQLLWLDSGVPRALPPRY